MPSGRHPSLTSRLPRLGLPSPGHVPRSGRPTCRPSCARACRRSRIRCWVSGEEAASRWRLTVRIAVGEVRLDERRTLAFELAHLVRGEHRPDSGRAHDGRQRTPQPTGQKSSRGVPWSTPSRARHVCRFRLYGFGSRSNRAMHQHPSRNFSRLTRQASKDLNHPRHRRDSVTIQDEHQVVPRRAARRR